MRHTLTALLALCAGPATAQQFVHQPGAVPGPVIWSEAAVIYDVQGDGQWDVLFASAQGWEEPGDFGAPSDAPLPPTLLLHGGVTAGMPDFTDGTAQYFPASLVMHAKNAAACDLNGDGRNDVVFAVAFGSRQRLFLKDPAAEVYLDESGRLPLPSMNGFGVGVGDLDDDGDLDIVFADAGPDSFSPPGGVARLLINDGSANFTDAAAQLGAIEKIGAQNAKIADIDGDLDLDVVIDGKSPVTQVYLNDGEANFTLSTTAVTPADPTSLGTYETEWADLDGDLDLDGMLMNFAFPLVDAAVRNNLMETGQLDLVASQQYMSGSNNQDENDFAFIDADNDGDLDVVVSTLLGPFLGEMLYINQGSFGLGSMVQDPSAFTPFDNSTLDVDFCDFDGDGRYDAITAEGEYPNVDFTNLYYKNTGPPDTLPPNIGRVTNLGATVDLADLLAGEPIRAWIEDAIVDDGTTYVTALLRWTLTAGGVTTPAQADMPHVGGYIHRAEMYFATAPSAALGGQIDYEVEASDPQGNVATSATGSALVCGAEPYGTGTGLTISGPSSSAVGQFVTFQIQGGPPGATGQFVLGAAAASIPYAGGELLVEPVGARRTGFVFDGNGSGSVDIILGASAAVGQPRYVQAIVATPSGPQAVALSAGVHIVTCAP